MNRVQTTGNDKKDIQNLINTVNQIISSLDNKGADISQNKGNAGDMKVNDYGDGTVRIIVNTPNGRYETDDLKFRDREE